MSIFLWNEKSDQNETNLPVITPFLVEGKKDNSAIIVCPGGGYSHRAQHEGQPVCEWLNTLGISTFLLDYRVAPHKHSIPMLDVKRAIRFVRFHAEKWNIDKNKIGILGFSAGGHLAATAGTKFDFGDPEALDNIEKESSRPDLMILCYPVISFVEHFHEGSIIQLLDESNKEEDRLLLSAEKHINDLTPPTFLWHTADDQAVPVENSLAFAKALSSHSIPYELHIFQNGRHGLGLATEENPHVALWMKNCEAWLRLHYF